MLADLRMKITEAIAQGGITGFTFVGPHEWEPLLRGIAERFLERGVRDMPCVWWWDCWKNPDPSLQPADALTYLESRLPREPSFWFLASEEDGKFWVAKASGEGIIRVLRNVHYFEYYIVSRDLQWIISENHHGVLSGCNWREVLEPYA
jgi:hypothetical protein